MVERKSGGKIGALVVAIVLAVAVSGCQKEIKGTIEVKGEKQIAFAQMAKISLADAINSAIQSYPGKAIKAELKNMDGFLVYSVEVVTQDNTVMEFTVDAGNGNILGKEPGKGGKD
ncbi:MAG: PepSY domain-containing protein [Syntrophobacteraceae bacterium]|nr:PepSY domain-containing protein [Syntrophobacteraceae bacterium]